MSTDTLIIVAFPIVALAAYILGLERGRGQGLDVGLHLVRRLMAVVGLYERVVEDLLPSVPQSDEVRSEEERRQ